MLFRFEVEGRENIPTAPFLIAANHQAWYDTAFIVAAFPKLPMIYTMARRDTVFNRRWKRWLMPRLGVFPIQPRQGELDERGVANVYQVLQRGGVVLIFPEGGYSRGRDLRPLRKGVAHFALQAGVPICPVAVSGVDRLRLFSRIEVSIAHPVRPDPPRWWTLNRRVLEVVDSVRRAIISAFDEGEPSRRPGFLRRLPKRLPGLLPRLPAPRPLRRRLRPGASAAPPAEPPAVPPAG
jgi:1-acyl-sn-glycerol-3-phosphate acyltransferase